MYKSLKRSVIDRVLLNSNITLSEQIYIFVSLSPRMCSNLKHIRTSFKRNLYKTDSIWLDWNCSLNLHQVALESTVMEKYISFWLQVLPPPTDILLPPPTHFSNIPIKSELFNDSSWLVTCHRKSPHKSIHKAGLKKPLKKKPTL